MNLVNLSWSARLGVLLAMVAVSAAGVGPLVTPWDPLESDFSARLSEPGWQHWMGTDQFGRDVASRVLAGGRLSLTIGALAVACCLALGIVLGAIAGFSRGRADWLLSMVMDSLLAMPGILLALAIMAVIGPSRFGLVAALGLAYAPTVYRVVRGVVLSLREKEYVEASRALGNSEAYTLWRHVLPNCLSPVIVLGASLFATMILAESALSFLGLGVPPPAPSWGAMLSESRSHFADAPWLAIFPGIAISLTVLGINLAGDALRDRFDPRMGRA